MFYTLYTYWVVNLMDEFLYHFLRTLSIWITTIVVGTLMLIPFTILVLLVS